LGKYFREVTMGWARGESEITLTEFSRRRGLLEKKPIENPRGYVGNIQTLLM
jgi:hypothetical protein